MFAKMFDFFNIEKWSGLGLTLLACVVLMTAARAILAPGVVVFPSELASDGDYWSMIGMSALLIAVDAMLIVLVSWSSLHSAKDVMGVALLVGLTHVFFPLITFGLTAGTTLLSQEVGLPVWAGQGVLTGIYLLAFYFVVFHLHEVHGGIREGDSDKLTSDKPAFTREWLKVVWPVVFAVSIDALLVGPAKIAFIERYTETQFMMSFVLIGASVFILVMSAGLAVLGLKKWIGNHARISRKVHQFDWIGSLLLILVFIHFSVFAGVYVIYTFIPQAGILEPLTIWASTAVIFFLYLLFGRVGEIKKASRERTGLDPVEVKGEAA
ncbi:MAG: hypothetical protein KBD29_00020 [Candidatus Magasanikbacteria bacterium]|nr:hypothetical protein [Candidatus Magasanikbacteria bacterium]